MDINKILNSKKLLTEIYFDLQEYYDNIYPNAVVLMEVGSFFETYEADGIGKAREISNVLNIQLTKKNKSINDISFKNPLMAGFPNHALDRYIEKLIESNYTIILIKQKGTPPNVKRFLAEIISPGVSIDYAKDVENYITSIIVEKYGAFHIGYSCIDINTGKSYIYEAYSPKEDATYALDELFRLLQTYKSSEIILTLKNVECDEIVNYLELSGKNIIINKTRLKIDYQNEIFKKVYNIQSLLSPIEVMNLEKFPLITEALAILLEFVISHNKELLNKISLPSLLESSKYVYLGNNPIRQLEIDKVLKLIDKTRTPMGRRLIKERLYNPVFDEDELKSRYKAVEFMLKRYKEFEEYLKDIYDLEKLYRKIEIKRLHPFELMFLLSSLKASSEIFLKLKKRTTKIDNFTEFLEKNFDFSKVGVKFEDIKDSFFKEGVDLELDELISKKNRYLNYLKSIKSTIEKLGDVKVELGVLEKEGHYISLTKNRFNLIKEKFLNSFVDIEGKKIFFRDFKIKYLTNSVKISGDFIDDISDKIVATQNKIIELTVKLYKSKLKEMEKYLIKELPSEIAKIDVAISSAKSAIMYNYHKPQIMPTKAKFIDLRHPLIEVNEENGVYVPNDVDFEEYEGLLLYGINSSGKSSLMKSVGIAVFLAQGGFFVPAKMFFTPFREIFTRISASDNLQKGLSTFAVEMLELKNIFNRAGENSLVLGDEIAHGTETLSALSIVASAIIKLSKKSVKFIFATHLHQLMDLEEIKSLKNIKAKHLEIYFDGEKLIYERKLKEGSGSSIYGIEFAKSIKMDNEFLNTAENIRKKLQNEYTELELLIRKKKSRYNKKVLITVCAICKRPVDDVHHIKEKEIAKDGFIGDMRVHHKYNLIPLCKEHHKMVHEGKIRIIGFKTTSDGIELHWEEV
ncbi:MAG: DNA mismatch repair protein MutS [Epsilonproteobacteria bacterium]|nr:DNA mismatch repair protein MutS [Campylobacterota bacterium]